MHTHIIRVDGEFRARLVRGLEADLVQHPLHHGRKPPRADILHASIHFGNLTSLSRQPLTAARLGPLIWRQLLQVRNPGIRWKSRQRDLIGRFNDERNRLWNKSWRTRTVTCPLTCFGRLSSGKHLQSLILLRAPTLHDYINTPIRRGWIGRLLKGNSNE